MPRTVLAIACLTALVFGGCGPSAPPVAKLPRKARPSTTAVAPLPEEEVAPEEAPAPPGQVEPVYRPDDARPAQDEALVAKAGIRRFESQRMVLYTDISEEQARPLLGRADEVYDAWEAWFGPMAPARDGREFQVTGYVMSDQERFREAGLLPETLPPFQHGRHRGQQFWMNDQKDAYYRAHLLLHEATHCFMTIIPNRMGTATCYMEGMAERFGTHFTPPGEATRFGVMPHDRDAFPGLGRIRMIADDLANGDDLGLSQMLALEGNDFVERNSCYAWSWALCQFLSTHPRYRGRFQKIEQAIRPAHAAEDFQAVFEKDWIDLQDEWRLFARNLCHGYDVERAAIEFISGTPVPAEGLEVSIKADRGWQSSRAELEAGRAYVITADGQFEVAQEPKPWVSEPQGVSIRYVDGRPLGQIVACLRTSSPSERSSMRDVVTIARGATFTPKESGTLYLRVNDAWNALADNRGEVRVTILRAP